jgi:hypothetical protein
LPAPRNPPMMMIGNRPSARRTMSG